MEEAGAEGSLLGLATPGPITPLMVSPEIIDSKSPKHGDVDLVKCIGNKSIAGIFVQPRQMGTSMTKGGTMIAKSGQVAERHCCCLAASLSLVPCHVQLYTTSCQ